MPAAGAAVLLLAAACATRSPWPAAAPTWLVENTSSHDVRSAVLAETRRVNVYVPPAPPGGAHARLPALYVPDGGRDEDFVHVAEAVHVGVAWGVLRPVVVVGVENTARRRDLTGPTAVAADRGIAAEVGGAAAFRRFLRDELRPWVDDRFPTGGPTAIIGESLAGLFVVETLLLEPDAFDVYVAFSPSLWWNDEQLVRGAAARLGDLDGRGGLAAALYLATADEPGIAQPTERLVDALRRAAPAGLRWRYRPMPEEHHDTIYRAAAPLALRTLLPAAPADRP